MSLVSDIENAFLTNLNTSLPIQIIPNYDGGPEPVNDYGVVGLTAFNKKNYDVNRFYDDSTGNFKESITQVFDVVITIEFYGDTCYEYAFNSQALLQMVQNQEEIYYNNNISIVNVNNVARIPELRDTGYIQKATYDVICLVGFKYVSDADYFDTVQYISNYYNSDDSLVYSQTNTVTSP